MTEVLLLILIIFSFFAALTIASNREPQKKKAAHDQQTIVKVTEGNKQISPERPTLKINFAVEAYDENNRLIPSGIPSGDDNGYDLRFKELLPAKYFGSSRQEMQPTVQSRTKEETLSIFLNWIKNRKYPIKEYPGYFKYKYDISDMDSYLKKALIDGYIKIESVQKELPDLKVTELKDILKANNKQVSGTKAELILRIQSELVPSTYESALNNDSTVSLTELGYKFLSENKIYVDLKSYSNWQLDVENYFKTYASRNETVFEDFAYTELNNQLQSQINAKEWNNFRCTLFSLYQLFHKDGRDDIAVYYLLGTQLIDLSGLYGIIDFYEKFNVKADRIFLFAPGIFQRIQELSDEITPFVIEKVCSLPLPFNICGFPIFMKIINEIVAGTFREDYWKKQLLNNAKLFLKTYKNI